MDQILPDDLKRPWPPKTHNLALEIIGIFGGLYMMARERMMNRKCPELQLAAERDEMGWQLHLALRERDLLRERLESTPANRRPPYSPEARYEILTLMRLQGLSNRKAAARYLVHHNTIGAWKRELRTGGDLGRIFGKAPFNKISEAVRWLVQVIRTLCPEALVGTRTIAMMIVRLGIQISRSTVQRVLREKKPKSPAAPKVAETERKERTPFNVLRPKATNYTWHLDLTTFDFLVIRFYVAVIVDGFSRKALALCVFRDSPTTKDMLRLVREAVRTIGKPKFLITDHGSQFRTRFSNVVQNRLKIRHIDGGRDSKRFNGKAERFFKTLKWWRRLTMFAWTKAGIQRKLDVYRAWYNEARPMWILDGRTPDEMWAGKETPFAKTILANDPAQPILDVRRVNHGNDPQLPTLELRVLGSVRQVA